MRRRGIAIIVVVALIAMLGVMAWAFLNFSQSAMFTSFRAASDLRAYHLAEAGIRHFLVTLEPPLSDREERLQFRSGEAVVTVRRMEHMFRVRSLGLSSGSRSAVVLEYSLDGAPLRRYEETGPSVGLEG